VILCVQVQFRLRLFVCLSKHNRFSMFSRIVILSVVAGVAAVEAPEGHRMEVPKGTALGASAGGLTCGI
jgi:hypothetical protein